MEWFYMQRFGNLTANEDQINNLKLVSDTDLKRL